MEEKAEYTAGRAQSTYLGDGVYATFDGYHVILYTYDGVYRSPTIHLDEHVIKELERFAWRCFERHQDERREE